jgi:hypothetical protein
MANTYFVSSGGNDSFSGRSSMVFETPSGGFIEVDEQGNLLMAYNNGTYELLDEAWIYLVGANNAWAAVFEVAIVSASTVALTLKQLVSGTFSPVPDTNMSLLSGFTGDGPFATLSHAIDVLRAGSVGDMVDVTLMPSSCSAYFGGSGVIPFKASIAHGSLQAASVDDRVSTRITKQTLDGLPANPRLAVVTGL